jgi:hypothetical protein
MHVRDIWFLCRPQLGTHSAYVVLYEDSWYKRCKDARCIRARVCMYVLLGQTHAHTHTHTHNLNTNLILHTTHRSFSNKYTHGILWPDDGWLRAGVGEGMLAWRTGSGCGGLTSLVAVGVGVDSGGA